MKRLLCLIVLVITSSAFSDSGLKWPTVKHEFTGPTSGFAPGQVTYTLVLYPQIDSGCMGVSVVRKDNLVYDSPRRTYRAFYDRTPLTFDFNLTVLPNDTSVFFLEIIEYTRPDREGNFAIGVGEAGAIFASTETTVNLLDHDPRPRVEPPLPEKWQRHNDSLKAHRDSVHAYRDSVRAIREANPPPWAGWEGPVVAFRDSTLELQWDSVASAELWADSAALRGDNFPRPWELKAAQEAREDSIRRAYEADLRETARRVKENNPREFETPDEQKARLIRENPVSTRVEFVADGKTLWVRRDGETEFSVSQGYDTREEAREAVLQQVKEETEGATYEIVLDLRDPEDREFIDSLGIPLQATDRPTYFCATVDRETLMKIEGTDIVWSDYPLYPDRTWAPEAMERETESKKETPNNHQTTKKRE